MFFVIFVLGEMVKVVVVLVFVGFIMFDVVLNIVWVVKVLVDLGKVEM